MSPCSHHIFLPNQSPKKKKPAVLYRTADDSSRQIIPPLIQFINEAAKLFGRSLRGMDIFPEKVGRPLEFFNPDRVGRKPEAAYAGGPGFFHCSTVTFKREGDFVCFLTENILVALGIWKTITCPMGIGLPGWKVIVTIKAAPVVVGEYRSEFINEEKVRAFVEHCYKAVFGREGDAEGIENYTALILDGKKTPKKVAYEFIFSPEFQNNLPGNEDFIRILYRLYLCREPGADELAGWVQLLEGGASLEEIVNGFAGSAEFKAIVNEMKN